jgi:hypothetical protein
MAQTVLLAVAIGVVVVNAIVFYLIIRGAVNAGAETTKRLKHAWAQTELLIAIARRQGVDEPAIKAITDYLK